MFKGTNENSLFQYSTSEIVDLNIKFWLDWSFLNIGAFENIVANTSGIYGGSANRLIPVKDRFYSDGQVWKFPSSNLVWESGLSYGTQPVDISGVYIDGTFSTSGSIDYGQGRVIFDSPISTTSTITANYSRKLIDIKSAAESDFFNELQGGHLRYELIDYGIGSGEYEYNRLQLPAVVYEIEQRRFNPYQLGLGHYSTQNLVYNVFAQDRNQAEKIADILAEQQDKTIFMFDAQLAADSGVFPLQYNGYLGSSPKTYNQLIREKGYNGYRWRKLTFTKSIRQKTKKLNNQLFHIPVSVNADLVLTNV